MPAPASHSTTSSDAPSVEQMRQRVEQIVSEIRQLVRSGVEPSRFFEQFLNLLCVASGAQAGAVWLDDSNGLEPAVAQYQIGDLGALESSEAQEQNRSLLREVITTGQARCLAPDHPQVDQFAVPCVVLLAPLQQDELGVGVVEVFHPAETSESARRGLLQFVEQMSGYASRYLTVRAKRSVVADSDHFWKELGEFALELQSSLNPRHVASAAVNDGRQLLGCDRVSVALRKGRKLTVTAVSGQDTVHKRSNLIRSMSRLGEAVLPTGQTFHFGGPSDSVPAPLKEPLGEFLQESGARWFAIVPLFEPMPLDRNPKEEELRKRKEKHRRAFGCLIVECLRHDEEGEMRERADIIGKYAAAALANARSHHRIFLRPLLSAAGRAREWIYGRKLALLLAALTVLSSIVLAMVLIKTEYRVEATGQLMPSRRQAVFAPWDGEIEKLFVEDGTRVEKGQPLLRLRNDELRAQLEAKTGELLVRQAEQRSLEAQIDDAAKNAKRDTEIRLQGQLMETQAFIRGLQSQIRVLTERQAALTVKAPLAGVVTTFRVRELLQHRPAQRGEVLLEIADDSGDWRLELDIDENRMGHVLRAQSQQRAPLDVEFVLATSPTDTYGGSLQQIATRPKQLPDEGSLMEAYVSIADGQQLKQRIGAEVRAKIHCGERSLAYVWFGDVVEFVQRRWWW